MHVGLSAVLLERNDLAGALEHIEASARLGEQAGLPQHPYRWRVATARIRRAQADMEGALELLDEAERVYNTDLSPAVRPVAAVRAQAQLASGDTAAPRRWASERGLTADDEVSYASEYEYVTLARVLLATHVGDRDHRAAVDDATRLLERLLAAADAGGRTGGVIEILIALSIAHQAGGDHQAATAALEQALTRAEPEGYILVFVDELPALTPLLRSTSLRGVAGGHAQKVLAAAAATAVEAGQPVGTPRQGLVDELSSRELDVLRLLRSDLSGPDMARELVVSLNTVRTHTKNIYMKLGVNNRREAVRRAAELGL
jgi:LuxR family maltose regulon positive regulatory protein